MRAQVYVAQSLRVAVTQERIFLTVWRSITGVIRRVEKIHQRLIGLVAEIVSHWPSPHDQDFRVVGHGPDWKEVAIHTNSSEFRCFWINSGVVLQSSRAQQGQLRLRVLLHRLKFGFELDLTSVVWQCPGRRTINVRLQSENGEAIIFNSTENSFFSDWRNSFTAHRNHVRDILEQTKKSTWRRSRLTACQRIIGSLF